MFAVHNGVMAEAFAQFAEVIYNAEIPNELFSKYHSIYEIGD